MSSSRKKILITGRPGVGKTTLIKKLCDQLASRHPVGFFTAEIRAGGIRKGFELIDLSGDHCLLAHLDIKSPHRVGKYGVDIPAFERYLAASPIMVPTDSLIIIDEIGKMECLSDKFKALIFSIMDSDRDLIAAVALKGEGFISQIKQHPDVRLWEITERNRDSILPEIMRHLTT